MLRLPIPAKLQLVLETLSDVTDRRVRQDLLVHYSSKFVPVPIEIAKPPYPDDNKVPFCESLAYVWGKSNPDGTLKFYFVVENPYGLSAKAMAYVLDSTLSGAPKEQVREVSTDIVEAVFGDELGMVRAQGLRGMVRKVLSFLGP